MGIQDHMKEVDRTYTIQKEFDRTDTIQIGVWIGSSGAIRIYGTQFARSSNYQYDKKRHNTRKVK
jgi:hypothetical protein